jgi:hypothetical protein
MVAKMLAFSMPPEQPPDAKLMEHFRPSWKTKSKGQKEPLMVARSFCRL